MTGSAQQPVWQKGPFQKSLLPLENPPTFGDLTDGVSDFCQTQKDWTCTGEQAGHPKQKGPTQKRPVMAQLICMQGPLR